MPPIQTATSSPERTLARVVGAIPARFGSSRLPGKPLRIIAGRSLIEHVYRRAQEATELSRVVVLTDDQRIAEMVSGFGGSVQLTPVECASGTDRIAVAAAAWDESSVINIQGDEPLIDPVAIDIVARHLKTKPADPIVTLAAPAASADRENPNVVKVVTDLDGRALYFSRAPIPYLRQGSSVPLLRHIGIYGYQRDALLAVASLPPSPLEICESLEQLRALENGIAIRVIQTECAWPGVDTIEDLEHVEHLLRTTLRAEPETRTGSRE